MGESEARNKYTYFASKAKKDGFNQIAAIFEETAANEKEHAKLWFKLLQGIGSTAENLKAAADGGDMSSISGWRRSPGRENGNPLQYSGREKSHGQRRLAGYHS